MGLMLDSESTGEIGEKGNAPKGENGPMGEEGRLSGGVCIPKWAPPAKKLPWNQQKQQDQYSHKNLDTHMQKAGVTKLS